MTMREKMARAMYELMRTRMSNGSDPMHTWENQSQALSDDWLATADAALDALMEPTEGMIEAGFSALCDAADHYEHISSSAIPSAFPVMIRAAKDGK